MHQHDQLTDAEIEVTKLLIIGYSNKKIAETRRSSVKTIQTHLRNIYSKLGVDSRIEATILLLDEDGFVTLADAKTAILERIKTGKTRIEYQWQ